MQLDLIPGGQPETEWPLELVVQAEYGHERQHQGHGQERDQQVLLCRGGVLEDREMTAQQRVRNGRECHR
jgi:hypothetical protein